MPNLSRHLLTGSGSLVILMFSNRGFLLCLSLLGLGVVSMASISTAVAARSEGVTACASCSWLLIMVLCLVVSG